ncbi:hypothetical protein HMN09_00342800 [Mycena chlorophos]|uniref:Uncharacterized protein n=1 Tax=Mycena chlorophos TaxID=658473 RepID=A0A8H6TME5_MYCCL|nr:hypothetical protein HMN09_00342800 [Mycena chlorophos]
MDLPPPSEEEPNFYDLPDGHSEAENSESDSDFDPEMDQDAESESDVEEEELPMGPSFLRLNTERLRAKLGGDVCGRVKTVLEAMDGAGLNLPIFLDAVSWGDAECIRDAKVRAARTSLMLSEELPGILRRWWKPPRISNSNKKRPQGGQVVMEAFARDVTLATIERELRLLGPLLRSPKGHDIDEDELTGVKLKALIKQIEETAPHLWALMRDIASSPAQRKINTFKSPTKVILAAVAILFYSRSHHNNRLQKLFAIYFKFRGLSAKGFDTLHALGLTMSNKWTGLAVGRISKSAMDAVVALIAEFPHLLSYDNATLSFRVFSQRVDRQPEFGHGAAASVYINRVAKCQIGT